MKGQERGLGINEENVWSTNSPCDLELSAGTCCCGYEVIIAISNLVVMPLVGNGSII